MAFVDDQDREAEFPLTTVTGPLELFAFISTVGATWFTFTITLFVPEPPAPLHVRLKALEDVTAGIDSLPFVFFVPDQLPDAVQEVAFVDDHDNETELPLKTVVDPKTLFAFILTVGDNVQVCDNIGLPYKVPHPFQSVHVLV